MSFLTRLAAAFRSPPEEKPPAEEPVAKQFGSPGSLAYPNTSLAYALGLWPSSTGVPISPMASLQASTVYACVRRLSEDIATRPIKIKKKSSRGGWADAEDHPLLKVFRAPNSWQTTFALMSFLVSTLQLRGNGYLYVQRGSDGTPRRLLPLIPDRVAVLLSDTGAIYYTITSPQLGNDVIYTNPEDLIHIRNVSLDGGIMGVSPIACSQDSIGLALATQRHGCLFFKQGSALGGAIETPARLSPEAAMRMAQSWQAAYSGSDNAHRIAVLEEGAKFTAISVNPQDAQLLETQKWSSEQICRIFAVPPWLVGLPVPTGTYSNVEQSQIQYVTNTLSNLAVKIEQELERVLLFEDERERYRIVFDFDGMERGDQKSRYEAYQIALLTGILSIDEVREREGLEALEQGGDEHRIPLNTGPAASKPTETTPEAPVEAVPQTVEQEASA